MTYPVPKALSHTIIESHPSTIPCKFDSFGVLAVSPVHTIFGHNPPILFFRAALAGLDSRPVASGYSGILGLKEVQLESAKRLPVKDFLRGCPVSPGTRLG